MRYNKEFPDLFQTCEETAQHNAIIPFMHLYIFGFGSEKDSETFQSKDYLNVKDNKIVIRVFKSRLHKLWLLNRWVWGLL